MLITDQPMKFLPQVVGQLQQLQILHTILLFFLIKKQCPWARLPTATSAFGTASHWTVPRPARSRRGRWGRRISCTSATRSSDTWVWRRKNEKKYEMFFNSDLATFYFKSRAVCVNILKNEGILSNFAIYRTCASSNTPVSFPNSQKNTFLKMKHYFFQLTSWTRRPSSEGAQTPRRCSQGKRTRWTINLSFIPNGSVSKIRNWPPVRELRPIRWGEPRLRVRLHQLQRGAGAGEKGLVFLGFRGGRAGHRRGRPWNVEKER